MLLSIIGWSGSLLYLLAQILLALFSLSQRKYVIINAAAAIFVSIHSLSLDSLQPIIINLSWSALSIISILVHQPVTEQPQSNHGNWKATTIIISGVLFLVTLALFNSINIFLSMSWMSVWLYLSSYLLFIFFRLSMSSFLLSGLLAAVFLLPQLLIDSNYPVITIQVLWIVTCLLGLFKERNGKLI